MPAQTVAIVVLFVLVAVVAFALHKHANNKAAHKTSLPSTTTPAPIGSVGGNVGSRPPAEQK